MPRDKSALMARMTPSISQITRNLYLGNVSASLDPQTLQEHGVTAIVSVIQDRYSWWTRPQNAAIVPPEAHLFVPCQDSPKMQILQELGRICDFIDKGLVSEDGERAGTVFVHCEAGMSRSATVVVAYLMRTRRKGLQTTLNLVHTQRAIAPSNNFMEQLKVWEAVEYDIWEGGKPKAEYQAFLDKRRAQP